MWYPTNMPLASTVFSNLPSARTVLSAYTSFAASAMVARTVMREARSIISDLVPRTLRNKISSKFNAMFGTISPRMVLIVEDHTGMAINELFRAAETYLPTRIPPSLNHLKVSKSPGHNKFTFKIDKGNVLIDNYEGIAIAWELICTGSKRTFNVGSDRDYSRTADSGEKRQYRIVFNKKHQETVMNVYLPYVLDRAKAIVEENRVVKLHAMEEYRDSDDESIVMRSTCSFETLAMDPKKKKELMNDLDRFVRRREFYKRIGKAWKRGYLLYGQPGTGKSSLVAAMANYLKFSVYDLELTSVRSNKELRSMLLGTAPRSIIVIEDIDCSIQLKDRKRKRDAGVSQLTLSGVLNAIDGLWSSCGDARIIVFTTNHKERLDPALLRPGRMDVHVHMTYLTPSGFDILAANYLRIKRHPRFEEIHDLLTEVDVTPAEIAEELMKSEDADVALEFVVEFVSGKKKRKRMENDCNSLVMVEKGERSSQDSDGGGDPMDEQSSQDSDDEERPIGKRTPKRSRLVHDE